VLYGTCVVITSGLGVIENLTLVWFRNWHLCSLVSTMVAILSCCILETSNMI
jgi:hypothetical protein